MYFWHTIVQMGAHKTLPPALRNRVRFANSMGFIMALAGISLVGIYLWLGRSNMHALVALSLFGLSVPFLNSIGANLLTRIAVSIAPALATTVFDITLKMTKPENLEIISYITPRYVVLASIMLPLVLFIHKERWLRNVIVLLLLLLVANFDTLFHITGVHFTQIRPDLTITLKSYNMQWVNMSIVGTILLTSTFFLLRTNRKSEQQYLQNLAETQATNTRLQESETKLKDILAISEQNKQALEQQTWVSTGLVHFLQILRQQQNFTQLCQILLSNIATYLQVQQGAMYWVNQEKADNTFLQLQAAYAPSPNKMQKTTFMLEEGLVGNSFTQQKIVHLKRVPQAYLHIMSGLGESAPQELLIMPLMLNGKSKGVIELSTFYTFEPHQIALLNEITEAVTTTLVNIELSNTSNVMLNELQNFKSKVNYL